MRSVLVLVCLLVLSVQPASAQGVEPEVRDVIARQVEAFRANDFEAAFEFASPGIRSMFGTSENFGSMVRNGYPMVWQPADVTFSDFFTRGGQKFQAVIFTDASGALHVFDYEMLQIDGIWRINGVYPRPMVGA